MSIITCGDEDELSVVAPGPLSNPPQDAHAKTVTRRPQFQVIPVLRDSMARTIDWSVIEGERGIMGVFHIPFHNPLSTAVSTVFVFNVESSEVKRLTKSNRLDLVDGGY